MSLRSFEDERKVLLDVYPIGSIYMSVTSTDPHDLFGGVWEALDQGRVLIGAGTSHPAGQEDGLETITLTTNELPSHSHTIEPHSHSLSDATASFSGSTGSAGSHSHSTTSSGSHSHTVSNTVGSGSKEFTQSGFVEKEWCRTSTSTSTAGSHSHTASSNGSHSHSVSGTVSISGDTSPATPSCNPTGEGQAFSIMQPYLAVYMWKRVS